MNLLSVELIFFIPKLGMMVSSPEMKKSLGKEKFSSMAE